MEAPFRATFRGTFVDDCMLRSVKWICDCVVVVVVVVIVIFVVVVFVVFVVLIVVFSVVMSFLSISFLVI